MSCSSIRRRSFAAADAPTQALCCPSRTHTTASLKIPHRIAQPYHTTSTKIESMYFWCPTQADVTKSRHTGTLKQTRQVQAELAAAAVAADQPRLLHLHGLPSQL